jgi:exo-beta-1,3-glucanase (GH17 family)
MPIAPRLQSPRVFTAVAAVALAIGSVFPGIASAAPVCHRPAAPASLEPLQAVMSTGRFIAYQPTQIKFYDGVATRADEAGIEADLRALRDRFDGLVTYSAANGAENVADVAARLGFRAVIIGIWSFDDPREVRNAIAAAKRQPRVVAGFSVGNERIFAKERSVEQITARIRALRAQVPSVPLTTTEPFHIFVPPGARSLLGEMDFMLANVHPVFQPWFGGAKDADAARFVVNVVGELAREYCGPILVKETGVPTAPVSPGFSPQRQASFFAELRRQFPPTRERAFAYFSAFDAAWRVTDSHPGVTAPQPQEGSWGLWEENRRPKPAAQALPPLQRR